MTIMATLNGRGKKEHKWRGTAIVILKPLNLKKKKKKFTVPKQTV